MGSSAKTPGCNRPTGMRKIFVAVCIGVLACTGAGVVHRLVYAYLARGPESVPMTAEELNRIPLQLGEWEGRDVPLDEAVVRATDTDAIVNRTYSLRGSGRSVGLYVAYGVRSRDMMPHRPEVCYPGTGHTMQDREARTIALADGAKLACTVYRFSGSEKVRQDICVLNYYIIDGRYAEDVSMLRFRAVRGQGGASYVAQVMLTCPAPAGKASDAAEEALVEFARIACPAIRAVLPGGARWGEQPPDAEPTTQKSKGAGA